MVGSLGIFFEVTVNSFILISGYFGMKLSLKRILRLILDMVVWGEVLYILSVVIGYRDFSVMSAVYFAVPVHWWFIVYYMVLMLFAPYINKLLDMLDKNSFRMLLLFMFFALSVAPTFLGYDFGGGVTTFILMYVIGRYIRKYEANTLNGISYFASYVVFSLLSAAGNYVLHNNFKVPYDWGITFFLYNSVFLVLASVCFFCIFTKIHFTSPVINRLAKSALGIYIIHEHPVVREFYLEKMGVLEKVGGSFAPWFVNFLVTLLVVYGLCLLVETIRLAIFDKLNDSFISKICGISFVKKFNDALEGLNDR